jgi:hypothetical protein
VRARLVCYEDTMRARLACLLVVALAGPLWAKPVSVTKVEAVEGVDTVVKIELSGPLPGKPRTRMMPKADGQPDRLAVDLPGTDLHGKKSRVAEVGWGGVQRIRLGTLDAHTARVVLDLDQAVDFDLAHDGAVIRITLKGAKPAE